MPTKKLLPMLSAIGHLHQWPYKFTSALLNQFGGTPLILVPFSRVNRHSTRPGGKMPCRIVNRVAGLWRCVFTYAYWAKIKGICDSKQSSNVHDLCNEYKDITTRQMPVPYIMQHMNTIVFCCSRSEVTTLMWRHNGPDGVSNHPPHDCLLNRSFRRRSKETSKLRVTGLSVGNSPVTGEFPTQMASTAENVSIWWCHHDEEY